MLFVRSLSSDVMDEHLQKSYVWSWSSSYFCSSALYSTLSMHWTPKIWDFGRKFLSPAHWSKVTFQERKLKAFADIGFQFVIKRCGCPPTIERLENSYLRHGWHTVRVSLINNHIMDVILKAPWSGQGRWRAERSCRFETHTRNLIMGIVLVVFLWWISQLIS